MTVEDLIRRCLDNMPCHCGKQPRGTQVEPTLEAANISSAFDYNLLIKCPTTCTLCGHQADLGILTDEEVQ